MPFRKNTPPPLQPDAPAPGFFSEDDQAAADAAFTRYERPARPRWLRYGLHLLLFLATLLTTTLAGVTLTAGTVDIVPFQVLLLPAAQRWQVLEPGLWFSIPFLGVLTVHEFGHYFAARYYRIRATLPYFIPIPLGIGTFGAVIRIKDRFFSRREVFDVGLAGPLAGLVVAVGVLVYGFTHLPPLEYLYSIHPEYRFYGTDYARHAYQAGHPVVLAQPLLFQGLAALLADPARLPHPDELLHYPVLMAGVLALFFTALNLLPIGQLDGGHIVYGLLGLRRAARVSVALFIGFIFYAGLGLFTLRSDTDTWLYGAPAYALYLFLVFRRTVPTVRRALLLGGGVWLGQLALASAVPSLEGNPGWLLFGLLLARLTGIFHPPAPDERPLSRGRRMLGWLMLVIFVLCFAPSPLVFR
ncbi:site-2 protease family protein [Hymenobacter weizhouensis]|uniref:site-2 protease family protein n=1 Tax=Hymenobacter sp. YIM 151500-1 TaxID=2987689 RepID=UPI0022270939|nr:site-2 protease family protein [Hymenobacter sp. YIM 151500-1]UYZ64747.1 site-2 protease family protein [Hymenobacter sp. YIM 151500-1]